MIFFFFFFVTSGFHYGIILQETVKRGWACPGALESSGASTQFSGSSPLLENPQGQFSFLFRGWASQLCWGTGWCSCSSQSSNSRVGQARCPALWALSDTHAISHSSLGKDGPLWALQFLRVATASHRVSFSTEGLAEVTYEPQGQVPVQSAVGRGYL